MTAGAGTSPSTRRRPPDRRAHILTAAARRFWSEGYHQVSMAHIAADVGIGASALYRHFRGKEELLLTVLDGQLSRMETDAAQAGDVIGALAAMALDTREFGVLWEREAGHLPEETRRGLRHRIRGLAARIAAGLDGDTADLRSWAVLSVLDSPSHHRVELDRARFAAILRGASRAVAGVELPDESGAAPTDRPAGLRPASRREALLAVAAQLFADRGYPSVGLDDIGAAAGIAGPSVYNHFASKADVLAAVLHRGNEALWLTLHRDLARASSPADGLRRLAARYARFTAEHPEIVGVLMTEFIHLPAERRDAFRRAQLDYVGEWVALLRQDRPGRDEAEALVRTHAALAVINSLSRIHHLRVRPGHVERTAALATAALELD